MRYYHTKYQVRDFHSVTSQSAKRTVLLSRGIQGQGQVQGRSISVSNVTLCLHLVLLQSATKLRRLCFHRCVSVHRGGAWSRRGVCWGGGVCSRGVWSGGLVSQHALRQTPRERQLLLRTVHILLECILVNGRNRLLLSCCSYLSGYTALF